MCVELVNPILPGFYPDPSICRVDDDFYLVTSSFAYFPGVPLFHSRDLVHWEQLGHVLNRPSQLPLDCHAISGGIFAPTIRHHDGRFYMITTNVNHGGNFIVTADDPAGAWSEPHWIAGAEGIDPSLFWDDDGRAYYVGTSGLGNTYPHIWLSEIDLNRFELVGEKTELWRGALRDCWAPEAPHIYKKDGWYYLMIAEGGTEHYHAVTMARSRCVSGPYEGYAGNPILTHRHLGWNHPICNVGHADLVQLKDGSWYLVALGSRIYGGYHKNLGRETFIAPVDWSGDWPVVSPGTGRIEWRYPAPDLPEAPAQPAPESVRAPFDSPCWNTLGTPVNRPVRISEGRLYIRCLAECILPLERSGEPARATEGLPVGALGFYGRRQQHMCFRAATLAHLPDAGNASCGIVVLQNGFAQLRAELLRTTGGIRLRAVRGWAEADEQGRNRYREQILYDAPHVSGAAELSICAEGQAFSLICDGRTLAISDGGFMGSETAGGFVGAYVGAFASGNGNDLDAEARFDWFEYAGS